MANVLEKIVSGGGVLPALASGKFGDENRGFAMGLLPGLMYKRDRKDDKKDNANPATPAQPGMKKGGAVKKYMKFSNTGKPLGMVPVGSPKNAKPKGMSAGGSASKRADGCAVKGKTKGRMV